MNKSDVWAADFETTLEQDFKEDGCVRVYLWHARSLDGAKDEIGYDAVSFIDFCARKDVKTVWFHNLKFDGSFILNTILNDGWESSQSQIKNKCTYRHIITNQGQWMQLVLMFGKHVCKIQDSAKKFPGMSLEQIARDIYGIEGKSDLDLTKRRDMNYKATEEDIERVKGDTRILMVAMSDLYDKGYTALTMASDALRCYKDLFYKRHADRKKGDRAWARTYPKLNLLEDAFIRRAYRGGWVYVNPRYINKDVENVTVYDVNSMYPAQMRFKELPYGKPEVREPRAGELYVVNFQAVFEIKDGKLPTYQNKNSVRNNDAEFVLSSHGMLMDLSMTNVDYELFKEHYDVIVEQGHKYYVFRSKKGLFDDYIDKWIEEKKKCSVRDENGNRDEAGRATAKRFLNSLYGKTGENPIRASKTSYVDDMGVTRFETVEEEGEGWYIPMATFITSYARDYIVRSAEKFGDDFVYADTDSIHCLNAEKYEHLLEIDSKELGKWDKEAVWEFGRYLAPKRYIHGHNKTDKPLEVKMAAASGGVKDEVTWDNFKPGMTYKEKLMASNVKGGCVLVKTSMTLKV